VVVHIRRTVLYALDFIGATYVKEVVHIRRTVLYTLDFIGAM